ncbi:MAG: hypothetical protein ACLFP9_09230, partial [Desulfonatronovibrio sp.]
MSTNTAKTDTAMAGTTRKAPDPQEVNQQISAQDTQAFEKIISLDISPEQAAKIAAPTDVHPKQKAVLAVHWHPEHIPMELIRQRIERCFPGKEEELIIPTQHNQLMSYDGQYSGVEVDCYSRGFKRKVQLLLHFKSEKLKNAHVLRSMLAHTFEYRSSQLFEIMDTIINPRWDDYLQLAAEGTGVDETVINFVRIQTRKLCTQLEENEGRISRQIIKNSLIPNYINAQKTLYNDTLINKALVLVKSVKKIVKANFSPANFYRTSEIIEEARGIGAGIIVPHPEQFWPILLCDYDVDGYEVWNPQSREYTEFLINVINRQNKSRTPESKLLLFMGDDTHMGEKIKDPNTAEASKYYRDIGVQPAWDDLSIKKSLIIGSFSR